MRAAARHRLGRAALQGLTVAVQGLGAVGLRLCRLLAGAGARLIVSDIDAGAVARAVAEFSAQAISPDAIFEAEADIFAPCALGAVLGGGTIRGSSGDRRGPRPTTSSRARSTARCSPAGASSTRPTTSSTAAASSTSPTRAGLRPRHGVSPRRAHPRHARRRVRAGRCRGHPASVAADRNRRAASRAGAAPRRLRSEQDALGAALAGL